MFSARARKEFLHSDFDHLVRFVWKMARAKNTINILHKIRVTGTCFDTISLGLRNKIIYFVEFDFWTSKREESRYSLLYSQGNQFASFDTSIRTVQNGISSWYHLLLHLKCKDLIS